MSNQNFLRLGYALTGALVLSAGWFLFHSAHTLACAKVDGLTCGLLVWQASGMARDVLDFRRRLRRGELQ